ncbi:MAG: AI-2E family transporter [Patescibacteria group bacterium]|jgi:predicted PurR-regulated permease PerM
MNRAFLTRIFLFILLAAVLVACFLLFRPFLVEILVSAVLASVFYSAYEWLKKRLGGREKIAAIIMCLGIVLVVIVPLSNLIIYGAQKSVVAYSDMIRFLDGNGLENNIESGALSHVKVWFNLGGDELKGVMIDIAQKSSNWLVQGAAGLLKGTTTFIISLILIIFTLFFFFVDGKKMLLKLTYWTPLPDKYDRLIFKKFKDVSYVIFSSTFAVAGAQAVLCAIGFYIVGLPVFFPAIATALLSVVPYIGQFLVWIPAAIYLFATGQIWQGIFMTIWGGVLITNIDNVIRMFMIKDKAEVHSLFILFSILGGIALFGFWGIVIGPLLISLAVTVFNIYDEVEYKKMPSK